MICPGPLGSPVAEPAFEPRPDSRAHPLLTGPHSTPPASAQGGGLQAALPKASAVKTKKLRSPPGSFCRVEEAASQTLAGRVSLRYTSITPELRHSPGRGRFSDAWEKPDQPTSRSALRTLAGKWLFTFPASLETLWSL